MRYLLASHGTPGAMAAEQYALAQCRRGDHLDHLLVIPEWWAHMTGDDWLNNGVSRNRYRAYVEQQLDQEAQQVFSRVQHACEAQGIFYSSIFILGDSSKVFRQHVHSHYEKIFAGSRRPSDCEGLNDRMLTKKSIKCAGSQLITVEHPYARRVT